MCRRGLEQWVATLGFLSLFGSGCSKKSDAPASASSAVAASTSAAPTSAASGSGAAPLSSGLLQPGETLAGRFNREAQSRPKTHPNADDIFAAFAKSGLPVPALQQSLGATYKAAYCTSGYTPDKLISLMICEYETEADANAGRDLSMSLFPKLSSRTVFAHKTNTLTIIDQQTTAAAKALDKKASDIFMSL